MSERNGWKKIAFWAGTVLLSFLGWGGNAAWNHLHQDEARITTLERKLDRLEEKVDWIKETLEKRFK
jgi:hypothetical protein